MSLRWKINDDFLHDPVSITARSIWVYPVVRWREEMNFKQWTLCVLENLSVVIRPTGTRVFSFLASQFAQYKTGRKKFLDHESINCWNWYSDMPWASRPLAHPMVFTSSLLSWTTNWTTFCDSNFFVFCAWTLPIFHTPFTHETAFHSIQPPSFPNLKHQNFFCFTFCLEGQWLCSLKNWDRKEKG